MNEFSEIGKFDIILCMGVLHHLSNPIKGLKNIKNVLEKDGIIFLLWGAFAQKKADLIDSEKHYVLETSHPSPFSAYRGFLGSKPFSKTNEILTKNNQKPINWNLCSDSLTLF